MRVHLKEKIKKNKKNFKVIHRTETRNCKEYDDRYFKNIVIHCDCYGEGGLYIEIDDVLGVVPFSIVNFVEFFSIKDTIYHAEEKTLRESGIYKLGTATGKVEKNGCTGDMSLEIKIRGEDLKDVRNLYLKIRNGEILPFESWETKQAVPNFTNFIQKLNTRIFKRH